MPVRLKPGTTPESLRARQLFTPALLRSAVADGGDGRGGHGAAERAREPDSISLTIGAAGLAGVRGLPDAGAARRAAAPSASGSRSSGRTRADLEREKALTLRSIKELEFDRAMGKVSPQDFDEMAGRLRGRAIGIMKQLEAGATAYRALIEKELRGARVGARRRQVAKRPQPLQSPPARLRHAGRRTMPTRGSARVAARSWRRRREAPLRNGVVVLCAGGARVGAALCRAGRADARSEADVRPAAAGPRPARGFRQRARHPRCSDQPLKGQNVELTGRRRVAVGDDRRRRPREFRRPRRRARASRRGGRQRRTRGVAGVRRAGRRAASASCSSRPIRISKRKPPKTGSWPRSRRSPASSCSASRAALSSRSATMPCNVFNLLQIFEHRQAAGADRRPAGVLAARGRGRPGHARRVFARAPWRLAGRSP